MKIIRIFTAAAAVTLISAGWGFAGSPDNPGGLGQTVNEAKAAWQELADNPNGWGQAVKENNAAGNPSLGQQLQAAKPFVGASPNPANDNGGGND